MTRKIIILGAIGNCIDILDTINTINAATTSKEYECLGFLDDDKTKWGKSIHGVPVLGGLEVASRYKEAFFVNGIGSPSSFWLKKEIIHKTNIPRDKFETIVHPTASVSPLSDLGHGVVVFQNVTMATDVTIQDHVIILPNSVISHGVIIGEYTCLAGGVVVNGDVRVGESCYLGANCSIKQGIVIGDQCLIGMGSVVLNDVNDNSVLAGNPAKFLRPVR